MYEKRFGLHRKPFQSVLSDHDFYQSETFLAILPGMLHALHSDLGVAVLTGPQGVGKSVTLEAVRRRLEGNCQAILIRGGTVKSAADLLYLLHRSLLKRQGTGADGSEKSSDTVRRWEVVERLKRVAEFWGPLVVLLDDAHLAEAEVFAELRALLEEEEDGQRLVRLLITGPLVLEEVLAEPGHADFAQKIRTHVFLQPLSSVESVEFLRQNISNAGGELSVVMEHSAIERIVAAADGIPRCLNLLADESLIVCEEFDETRATRVAVDKALKRLQHLPYAWNVSLYDDSDDDDFDMEASENAEASQSANAHSIVEIGGTGDCSADTSTQSSHGVIEIGGPSSAPAAAPQPKSEPDVHGVIEIGAPSMTSTPQPAVVETAVVDSEVSEVAADEVLSEDDCVTTIDLCEGDGADVFCGVEVDEETFFADDHEHVDEEGDVELLEASEGDSRSGGNHENEAKLAALLAKVTFKNGTIAVKKSETEATPTSELTGAEVSLEHHLLLANSESRDASDDDECSFATAEADAAAELDCVETQCAGQESFSQDSTMQAFAEAVVAGTEFSGPESLDTQQSQAVNAEVSLDGFSPWEPAGEWPVAVSAAESTAVQATAMQPQSTGVKPVFDRYTWCELGRSVTPIQRNRLDFATVPSLTVWPPVTDGIAPADTIPVETIHEDYAELLMDLGMLVDAASEGAAPVSKANVEGFGGGAANVMDTTDGCAAPENAPDAVIDEIQNLIDIDQDNYSEGYLDHDSSLTPTVEGAGEEFAGDSSLNAIESNDAPDWIAGQLMIGEGLSDLDAAWPAVPTGNDTSSSDDTGFGPDPHAMDPGLDSITRSDSSSNEAEVQDTDVVQDDEQLLCEERCLGDFVAEDEEQLYVPRLMQQARQRVTGHSVRSGRLRFAAGAEGYNVLPASLTSQPAEIRLARAETAEMKADDEQVEPEAKGGRFQNLFTRLRKLRKTSA